MMPIVRRDSPYVLRPMRARVIPIRGMGQIVQDPCNCFYPVAGVPNSVTNPNNLPQCDPTTGMAPACKGVDEPPCAGIAFGQPGYAECMAYQTSPTNPVNIEIAQNQARLGLPVFNPAASAAPIVSASNAALKAAGKLTQQDQSASNTVAQSNAPNPTTTGSGTGQSNAPNANTQPPAQATTSSGMPSWVIPAAVIGGGVLLAMTMGGHR